MRLERKQACIVAYFGLYLLNLTLPLARRWYDVGRFMERFYSSHAQVNVSTLSHLPKSLLRKCLAHSKYPLKICRLHKRPWNYDELLRAECTGHFHFKSLMMMYRTSAYETTYASIKFIFTFSRILVCIVFCSFIDLSTYAVFRGVEFKSNSTST